MMTLASRTLGQLALLFTASKAFRPGGLIGSPAWNELGLHVRRVQLAYALNRWRRARLAPTLAPQLREAFDRDGFVICTNFLAAGVFAALERQVRELRTEVRERSEGSTLLRKIPVDAAVLAAVPALEALRRDPRFGRLLDYGEGHREPPDLYLQTVTQRPGPGAPPDPQCSLHRDTFHPSVKAWLYLTPVPESVGPLVYVPGSHRLNPERLLWEQRKSIAACQGRKPGDSSFRVHESELAGLGYGAPRVLAVPANTLVVADTFGFHARGASDGPAQRVEVWAIGRRSPFVSYRLDRLLQALAGRRRSPAWTRRPEGTAFDLEAEASRSRGGRR